MIAPSARALDPGCLPYARLASTRLTSEPESLPLWRLGRHLAWNRCRRKRGPARFHPRDRAWCAAG